MTRSHWSYSQLAQYLRCPLLYFFQRIAKLPSPFAPSGLVLGKAVHAGLAMYHRQLQLQQPVRSADIGQELVISWAAAEAEKPVQYRPGETRESVLEAGLALVDLYLQQPAPNDIVAVEQAWLVPLITSHGEILETPLLAIVDLLVREDGQPIVVEFKTSSRRYSEADTNTALQATTYAHVVADRFGMLPQVRYTVLVKSKTPTVQRIEVNRTEAETRRLADIFQTVESAIGAGVFYPVENAQNCTGCAYRQPCRSWRGTRITEDATHTNDIEAAKCSPSFTAKAAMSAVRPVKGSCGAR